MKKEALHVSSPPAPGPFDAALVETGRFPDHEETPEFVRNELRPWLRKLAHEHSLQPAAWIQGADLHEGNAADLVRKHGAQWIPETGLGVWPDREPPRLWSAEDFHELDPGQKIRPMMYTVFHVSGGTEASEHALSTLAGSGTLIYALLASAPEEFHRNATERFLPEIREEALRGYPFYMPLLDIHSLQTGLSNPDTFHSWMGTARVYVRESAEDRGILLISGIRNALRDFLESIRL
ncbi:MAG TPA: hypothetical protein VFA02_01840 [Pseudacidobacterium sp.]|nr:hypothetical protein [Pseudacidobacterium sp.]